MGKDKDKSKEQAAAQKVKSEEKESAPDKKPEEKIPPRLRERYLKEIVPNLCQRLGYRNPLAAPRVTKVVVNMGVGTAVDEPKTLENAVEELAIIAGQKPVITRAKKSIAAFKIRQKMAIGCKVVLRRDRMYEFLDRLFNVALPRIRDFRGLPARSVDGRGNYSLGIEEQTIFPEVNLEKVERVRGMDVTIVTTAQTDEEARALLVEMGLPLREMEADRSE